jgi:hypothetical protein
MMDDCPGARMPKHVKTDEASPGEKKHLDALLDEALKETFPASDPPAMIGVGGEKADPPHGEPRAAAAKK